MYNVFVSVYYLYILSLSIIAIGFAQVDCYTESWCDSSTLMTNQPVDVCCLHTTALAFKASAGAEVCSSCFGMLLLLSLQFKSNT